MTLLRRALPALAMSAAFGAAPITLAQQSGRPAPAQARPGQERPGTDRPRAGSGDDRPTSPRRPDDPTELEGMVRLAFNDVGIKETLPFIAEATGKVVMPLNLLALQTKKITLMNDAPVPKTQALDLLFQAFRINGVGVIEKDDVLIVGMIEEVMLLKQHPVLPAEEDILHRQDRGSLVVKIYRLTEAPAEMVGEQLQESLPTWATLTVDTNSNQIILYGDISLCQHVQEIIDELDHSYLAPRVETFRLAYADAAQVAENIIELFDTENSGNTSSRQQSRRQAPQRGGRGSEPGGQLVGPEIELRVTVNSMQNSVTVSAEPSKLDKIRKQIVEEWDLPRAPGTSKIYTLRYVDPVKVAEKLNSLLGDSSGGGGPTRRPGAGNAEGASVQQILSGIYQIEAYEDSSQLFVFCKTEEAIAFLDDFIEKIDQPSSIGLPIVIELKHANAVDLAEELNALLAEAGRSTDIARPDSGLSGRPEGESVGTGTDTQQAGRISFPWMRGGGQDQDKSPESSLIGKVRIVPIVRQNALAILSPAPQQEAMRELIEYFDRPGRQVMISAVIAAVELTDELSLGLRVSNSDDILGGGNPDFRVGGVFDGSGSKDDIFPNLFDTSVLDMGFSLNVALQALSQNTNVRIIQEPIIYTADNQEAIFFDGQDIPFISNTTVSDQGNPTDSFDYREVGVTLNARPRITKNRTVDMEVLLELSNVVPGQTLFGGAIVDRRETRTHVIVEDGQTILIAGILKDEDTQITRKLPLLGDIPLIGEIFKSRENTKVSTEIIAFITPHVVDNPEENDYNFQVDWLDHLKRIRKPLDDQWEDFQSDPEGYLERMMPVNRSRGRGRPAPAASAFVGEE